MLSKFRRFFYPSPTESKTLNINEILKPIYYTLTLFGMVPYNVRYSKRKECFIIIKKSIYMNSLCAISFHMILITFLLAHIQNIRTDNGTTAFTDVVITQANYIVELAALYLFCIVLHVSTYLHRFDYVQFQNTMAAAWAASGEHNRSYLLQRIRFQVHIVIGSLIFLLALQLCVNSSRNDNLWKITLVTFSFILPQMIQFISLAFYYILIVTVGALLSDINMELESLTESKIIYDDFRVKVEERNSHVSLSQMVLAYVRAFELKKGINDAYNGPLLISTIQCFHCIVSEAHIMYHEITVNTYSAHALVNGFIWILYQLLKVFCVAYSGSVLKTQALKIVQTLHKIPTERHDRRTYAEIQHFCTLMNYHGFGLSVYEIFTIDADLFSTMIATVTMNLFILIQLE